MSIPKLTKYVDFKCSPTVELSRTHILTRSSWFDETCWIRSTLLKPCKITFEIAPYDQTYPMGDVRFHRPSLPGDLRSTCERFLSDVPQVEFRMNTRTSVLLAAKFEPCDSEALVSTPEEQQSVRRMTKKSAKLYLEKYTFWQETGQDVDSCALSYLVHHSESTR